ncbi:MAG: sulfatase-like hydrolase/transferase [Paludibaculum sp.]
MNRREFLSTSAAQALAPKRRPNVLYLHSHDTGRYIEPYGHPVPTPNLQKFASQGVLFRRAFSAAPTCSPSRAALLTGQTAHGSGMLGLAHRGFSLSHPERHLANFLQSNGYDTTLCNVQHETKAGTIPSLGYQRVLKTASNRGPDAAAAAVEYLNSKPKAPFFLSCGFFETHREYPVSGPKEDPRYTLPPAPMPDTPSIRQDMANFKAAARVLDDSMGSILEALARNGLEENTLVVLTTDHGIAFPAMKCNLTDHGIGVMLMMRGPGGLRRWQGLRLDGFAPGRLSHSLRDAGTAETGVAGRTAARSAGERLGAIHPGRGLRRGLLSRGLRAKACPADRALQVHP